MDTESTSLGRGLFGFKRKDVERMLADRATMLSMAAQRAQAAEARAAQLDQVAAQVAELQQQIAQGDQTVAGLQAEVADREAKLSQLQADSQQKDSALARMQSEGAERERAIADGEQSLAALQATEQQLHAEIEELNVRLEREAANRDVVAQDLMRELGPIIAAAEESARRITENAESESAQKLSDATRTSREAQANLARLTAWRDQLGAVLGGVQNAVTAAQREIEELPARLNEALKPIVEGMDSVSSGLVELSRTSLPERVVDQAPRVQAEDEVPPAPEPSPAPAEADPQPVMVGDASAFETASDWSIQSEPEPEQSPSLEPSYSSDFAYDSEPDPAPSPERETDVYPPDTSGYASGLEAMDDPAPESTWPTPDEWTDERP